MRPKGSAVKNSGKKLEESASKKKGKSSKSGKGTKSGKASADKQKEKRTFKFHPGTVALREIKRYILK